MTLVVDASMVVAALIDAGPAGKWARAQIVAAEIAAPDLLPYEVTSALRRLSLGRQLSPDVASLAHADLALLRIELFPYAPVARRVWELRANVTPYDAAYVALAESLGAELATLDRKHARLQGARCDFRLP